MLGLWLQDRRLTLRTDLPVPQPAAGEALIQVTLAGICSTDLEMVKGYYPFTGVPGHEFVGRVADAPGLPDWAGKRVVGEINLVCGRCEACTHGRSRHCADRTVLGIQGKDGVFAQYVTLPVENLHPVPDGLADEIAVFAEPAAAALEIAQQVHLQPGMKVLLVGAGRLGQLAAQALAAAGVQLQVVARNPRARQLLSARGIPVIAVEEILPGWADVVVEASGSPDGFHLARKAVRPEGTIVLKSTYQGRLEVDFSSVVVDEITLIGSRCGPFAPALRMLAAGQIDPRPLLEKVFPLENALEAYAYAAGPSVMKVALALPVPGAGRS